MKLTIPIELDLTPRSDEVMAALERSLNERFVAREPAIMLPHGPVPRIGEYWTNQGGIYAGMCRGRNGKNDYPLILAEEYPKDEFTWQDALGRAKTIEANGHKDFDLPDEYEGALLYANLRELFAQEWHWLNKQCSEDSAWSQYFGDGGQGYYIKSYGRRARFVRRPLIL